MIATDKNISACSIIKYLHTSGNIRLKLPKISLEMEKYSIKQYSLNNIKYLENNSNIYIPICIPFQIMENIEQNDSSLDEKDLHVLEELRQNAKRTTSQISKRINIPITTVHNRIKKLEKLGIIKHYTVEVDHAKLGKPISAYIMVSVVYMLPSGIKLSQEDVAKHIKGIAGVESVEIMTGETDLLVKIRIKDIEELNDFVIRKLRKVEGVDKTRTMIVLSEI